jgi:hypothetical protein
MTDVRSEAMLVRRRGVRDDSNSLFCERRKHTIAIVRSRSAATKPSVDGDAARSGSPD